jgi:hypothetical protein
MIANQEKKLYIKNNIYTIIQDLKVIKKKNKKMIEVKKIGALVSKPNLYRGRS